MEIRGTNFAGIYKKILKQLIENPEYITSPRGQQIKEITNHSFVLTDPISCLYINDRRSSQFKYICAELLWYLTGSNDVKFISHFSKFWESIKNPDDTVNSAYGYLLFKDTYNPSVPSQWEWAYKSLVEDENTRQAVLHFNKPYHQWKGNKDFVCTMYGNFLIRDNALHFTIHMRSNDVILGLPTDLPFFVTLQLNMWNLLKKTYPNIMLGSYTHIVNSLHIYERNEKLASEMLEHDFAPMDIMLGAEDLLNEHGKCIDFITKSYNFVTKSDYPVYPDTPFERFINKHLFEND